MQLIGAMHGGLCWTRPCCMALSRKERLKLCKCLKTSLRKASGRI